MDGKAPLAPLRLIEDQPRDGRDGTDYLDMDSFARVIAGAAVGTGGPFAIGVYAGWGEGKTSLLRQAKGLIDDDPQACKTAVTVWFNAWQFEREEHPLFPLIAAIVDAADKRAEGDECEHQPHEGYRKLVASLRALTRGMKFTTKVGVPLLGEVGAEFDAKKALDAEETLLKPPDPLQGEMLYQTAFAQLEAFSANDGKGDAPKVVVFIDDLDRCMPENAVRLLECIKLVLSQPGFVFVLALDNAIVEAFLKRRYRREYGVQDEQIARTYLHKLVQLELPIPRHNERFGQYVRTLLAVHKQAKTLKPLSEVLTQATVFNPRALVRLVNNVLVDLALWPHGFADGSGQGRWKRAQVTACMAVGRVVYQRLGRAAFHALVENPGACRLILQGGETPSTATAAAVEEDPVLWELLRGPGRVWLEEDELRALVYSLHQQREAISDVPETQQAIFDRAVRRELKLPPEAPVPEARLAEVSKLSLVGESEFDDRGLALVAELTELTILDLSGTQVSDLEPLAELTGLVRLDARNTSVTDLTPLAKQTGLKMLDLSGTGIRDLKPLVHLAGLIKLSLVSSPVSELAPLAGLTGLTQLYLTYTQVNDLTPLAKLIGLTDLHLSGTQTSDLTPLRDLTGLTELHLSATQVGDVTPLAGLTGLRTLDLTGTPVSDVTPLTKLTRLAYLYVSDSQVGDEQVQRLQKRLPKLKVTT